MSGNGVEVAVGNTFGESEGVRLYICQDDKQIIPLPNFTGPYYADHLLHRVDDDHGKRGHAFAVITVNKEAWDHPDGRAEIKNMIANSGGQTGIGGDFYDVKDQFVEDALSCFKAHFFNENCSDYNSNEKRLTPGTAAARKAADLPEYRSARDVYLCQFCPVHTKVLEAQKLKAGLYS